jgi:hypothetical protein
MMRATLLAATLAMAILMAGCGEEGAGQGSGHESEAEPRPSQAKQEQPKKPQTVKGEVAKKPSQEQHQQKPEKKPEPDQAAPKNMPGLTPQHVYLNLETEGFKCNEPELIVWHTCARATRLSAQPPSYSPECVEVEFSEVELPLYGVLRSSRWAWPDGIMLVVERDVPLSAKWKKGGMPCMRE